MSYTSQPRYPYGLAVHPMAGVSGMTAVPAGMSGMTPVPGMPGMTAIHGMTPVPGVPGAMTRTPNGMSGLYPGEKASGLYPVGTVGYQALGQPAGILAQSSSLAGQPAAGALYGASQPTYIPVSSPTTPQRYMMSPSYAVPGAPSVSSPAVVQGATGYPLTAGAGYALQTQSSIGSPVHIPTSLTAQAGSQYPTYIGSGLTPIQISPSQNPYAASATGHPLYPGSPYASLQLQASQVGGQLPSALGARVATVGPGGTGQLIGYPAAPQIGSQAFYQAP